jgi:hypothetical protein
MKTGKKTSHLCKKMKHLKKLRSLKEAKCKAIIAAGIILGGGDLSYCIADILLCF